MIRFDIFTLFPEMFQGALEASILGRARAAGLVKVLLHNPRDVTTDRHHIVDDYPYGGGAGMVMKPEPIFEAVERVYEGGPILLLSPSGRVFDQAYARELAQEPLLTLLCGHYEGIDERVREHLATGEVSIGDYVLTGGELAAMVIVDAVVRLLPGVLAPGSTVEESHADGLLEYPHYTRPAEYRGWPVPEVLLGGNHGAVARWRRKESLRRTREQRPDLFARLDPSPLDRTLLAEIDAEQAAKARDAMEAQFDPHNVTVLVVDDEPRLVDVVRLNLEIEGYRVIGAANGYEALESVKRDLPDLVILDVMMPGMDGFETLRQIRDISNVPVIMLTVRAEESDRIRGLEIGADDYLTKPYSSRELRSRVKAVLRRTFTASPPRKTKIVVDDDLTIDFSKREVCVRGQQITLRPTEYRLLYHLIHHAGRPMTHESLLAKVWGPEYHGESQNLRLYITYLRQKLERDPAHPKYILTERGVGYRFRELQRGAERNEEHPPEHEKH